MNKKTKVGFLIGGGCLLSISAAFLGFALGVSMAVSEPESKAKPPTCKTDQEYTAAVASLQFKGNNLKLKEIINNLDTTTYHFIVKN